jgi:hypothetical protein
MSDLMKMLRGKLVFFLLLALMPAGLAQTANTRQLPQGGASPPARIEQMGWLQGNWLGTGFGDLSEETWAPPRNGSMIGLFRQHGEGKPLFYELMLLRETEDGSLELRLKHFHPDIMGWEEKDKFLAFKLVALEEKAAYFNGLTYRLEGDKLSIFLALKEDDGKAEEFTFTLERTETEPWTSP